MRLLTEDFSPPFFNKFVIKMFYPAIRKKGKFEIQTLYSPPYSYIFIYFLIASRNEFLGNLMMILVRGRSSILSFNLSFLIQSILTRIYPLSLSFSLSLLQYYGIRNKCPLRNSSLLSQFSAKRNLSFDRLISPSRSPPFIYPKNVHVTCKNYISRGQLAQFVRQCFIDVASFAKIIQKTER